MSNKRKNIPEDLLKELLTSHWGNIAQTRIDLAKNGYHCDRRTILAYIEEFELEQYVEDLRNDLTELKCYELINNIDNSPDPDRQRQFLINTRGHKIGWRPNEVKHIQDLEKIEAQKNADKDLIQEQMRKEMQKMPEDL